jgi:sugar fermentation stimulation protein A
MADTGGMMIRITRAIKKNEPGIEAPLFGSILKGTFLERPNRFIVRCRIDGRVAEAYLPNPGKLWELLLPGRTLYLVENPQSRSAALPYMTVAVEREGAPVLLHTHKANQVVAGLLEQRRIPGLEDARIVRREVTVGRSRFDFLLDRGGRPFLLEVKSCTLFGRCLAMFPDAVTVRGRRHLTELADLSRKGTPGGVLFLVSAPRVRFFLPDYHTDLDFARTFLDLRQDLLFKAVSVRWRGDLTLGPRSRELTIPWDLIGREARDSGDYLLILQLATDRNIAVGGLGEVAFPKGYYLYAGSARTHLRKRLARHLRKRKNFFWHIDYLRDQADACTAIPIRSSERLEHRLAGAVGQIADWFVPRFGASDCDCESHLFGMRENPVHDPRFIALLQDFRIDRLSPKVAASGQNQKLLP